ncbi:Quinol oxidase subunit 3 [Paraconexibacter sp. AEG42_29]|uniref:Cytochrome aa3 subunit 3 n=1 Tax=Paraconexibacter sp. AEG42_29 TaxID=2997339 RepID=A0AAU7ASL8_9ACTN
MREMPAFLEPRGGPVRPGPLPARPAAAATASASASRVPGEAGIWVFLLGDMTMFGVFFVAFLVQRGQNPELFADSREALTVGVGAVNTLVLLTSSLLVALAVRAHRLGRRADSRRLVALTALCGAVFAAVKVAEWVTKLDAGHHPGDDLFFTYYYLLTGIHFLHVIIGAGVLAYWHRLLRRPAGVPEGERRAVECCASYWHMVDLLWVVIFPVLYLSAT